MRYIKMLGLVALTAIAAMVLAATAFATELTSPAGTTYTGGLVAEATSEITFKNGFTQYGCKNSTAEGEVTSQGSTVTASGKLTKWTLTNCNMGVFVLSLGTVEVHTQGESSNGNGVVTVTGTEVTTSGNTHCVWKTSNTSVGVFTGSNNTKSNATLTLEGKVPRVGGSSGAFCGSVGEVVGSFKVTTPSYLAVD